MGVGPATPFKRTSSTQASREIDRLVASGAIAKRCIIIIYLFSLFSRYRREELPSFPIYLINQPISIYKACQVPPFVHFHAFSPEGGCPSLYFLSAPIAKMF